MFKKDKLFQTALLFQATASAIALALFAYLGTFTRLLADDYYHIFLTRGADGLIAASYHKYLVASNRYTNLLLFRLADLIGAKWMPALFIILWLAGLTWLLWKLNKYFKSNLPFAMIFAIAALLAYLSILQAPNRYQTIYWLSGMVTYFAPLAFFPFLLAGNFAFLRQPRSKTALLGMGSLNILVMFLIGGLSETVGAMHISIVVLILVAFWIWGAEEERMPASILLGAILLGAFISLAAMAFAPANAIRSSDGNVALLVLFQRLLIFPYGFITDTFKTLPLPSVFTVLVAFLIFANPGVRRTVFNGIGQKPEQSPLNEEQAKRMVRRTFFVVPLITFAIIAASFAPSAYALSYPDARVRFPARFVMTSGLFIEGALLGLWLGREKFRVLVTLLLAITTFYPLRGAWQACQALPKYRAYADAWDTRDAYIRSKRDGGMMDIAVPPMDGMAGIKEFDVDADHWVNRGAADYYGVDAISVHSTSLDYDE